MISVGIEVNGEGPYRIETSPLICVANQWTGFDMIGTSIMNELILKPKLEDDPFIKKRLQHRCFPVNIAKFLRTTFL